MSLAADNMSDVGRVGAAKRRKYRQFRAFHRHEQLTVRMELATALHHSAQRPKSRVVEGPSEHEKYVGLRAQKPPLPGKRPGLPQEPEPLGRAVTDGYVAAQTPVLVVASMAGGDSVDGSSLKFLPGRFWWREARGGEEDEREKGEGGGGALLSFLGNHNNHNNHNNNHNHNNHNNNHNHNHNNNNNNNTQQQQQQ